VSDTASQISTLFGH